MKVTLLLKVVSVQSMRRGCRMRNARNCHWLLRLGSRHLECLLWGTAQTSHCYYNCNEYKQEMLSLSVQSTSISYLARKHNCFAGTCDHSNAMWWELVCANNWLRRSTLRSCSLRYLFSSVHTTVIRRSYIDEPASAHLHNHTSYGRVKGRDVEFRYFNAPCRVHTVINYLSFRAWNKYWDSSPRCCQNRRCA